MNNSKNIKEKIDIIDERYLERVELKAFTKMSYFDGINSTHDYIKLIKKFNIKSIAITDFNSTEALPELFNLTESFVDFKPIYGVTLNYVDDIKDNKNIALNGNITLLAVNSKGVNNINRIISSALNNDNNITLRSFIKNHKEGVLVGNGYIVENSFSLSDEEIIEEIMKFDYIEISPPSAYSFNDSATRIKRIIDLAIRTNVLVVAVSNCHYISSDLKQCYDILRQSVDENYNKNVLLNYRDTDEMLSEFRFLPKKLAYEIVVTNSNLIADRIERIDLFDNSLKPKDDVFNDTLGVPSIKEELKRLAYEGLRRIYGNNSENFILERVNKELEYIFQGQNEYILYVYYLVTKKLKEDGHIIEVNGKFSCSLLARLLDISSINPLPRHYRCNKCKYHTFNVDSDLICNEFKEEICPVCGSQLIGDGYNIPPEIFLGITGLDKKRDIDIGLTVSSSCKDKVIKMLHSICGPNNVFKIGFSKTILPSDSKRIVYNYLEKNDVKMDKCKVKEIARHLEQINIGKILCSELLIFIPKTQSIYDFTPVKANGDLDFCMTSYFLPRYCGGLNDVTISYSNEIEMLEYMMEYVSNHQNEFSFNCYEDIPVNDKNVYNSLYSNDVIGLNKEELEIDNLLTDISELDYNVIREILSSAKPLNISQIVKAIGLAFSYDAWNSGTSLINVNKTFRDIPFYDLIGTREEIMEYLIRNGIPKSISYSIMQFVIKGKQDYFKKEWREYKQLMRMEEIPKWFIIFCDRIRYLPTRFHIIQLVLKILKLAWFKVYSPSLFYSACFSFESKAYDEQTILKGADAIKKRIKEFESYEDLSDIEENMLQSLKLALEATLRGISFLPSNNEESTGLFTIEDGNIRFPRKK